MSAAFEKFSEKARRVLSVAQDEVSERNQSYISAEHLLLGLIRETEGLALRILTNLGADTHKLRASIEVVIGKQEVGGSKNVDEIRLSPRTQKILRLAVSEANQLNQQYIGTEHLLIAVLRDWEDDNKGDIQAGNDKGSVAGGTLNAMGITLEGVLKEIDAMAKDQKKQSRTTNKRRSKRATPPATSTPSIDKYGMNLTKEAMAGNLDEVIGREDELKRLIQVVSRRTKNNPVLIGEPGVGKTAIVEKFAMMIVKGDVPEFLQNKQIITFEMGNLVAGTKYRGEFEDRLQKIITELSSSSDYIAFIDEMHTIIGAGAAEGSVDAANILKPALARGKLQVIGATTVKDYRKYVERDPAFERRFQPIMVNPPTTEMTVKILKGVRKFYEKHHGVVIGDKAVAAAVQLSSRYITDRELPDKAIDVMDEAAADVRIRRAGSNTELLAAERELTHIRQEKENKIAIQDYESAADLRDRELQQISRVEELRLAKERKSSRRRATVTEEDVARMVSLWTKIPLTRLRTAETRVLLKLEENLKQQIIGQDEAISAVAKAVYRSRAGFKDPNRPAGVFLFLGPTGVGKTYIAKQLARLILGDEKSIIRLDMSEFMERHTATKLIGAPPSYVGYEEGGQLTEAVRRKSYSIVLLDEMEKAHPDVFNVFLQVMEDGQLTDAKGRVVDFKNTIIVMTSNLGSEYTQSFSAIGFGGGKSRGKSYADVEARVMEVVKDPVLGFRPEFINRLDAMVVFKPLNEEAVLQIVDLMVDEIKLRALEKGITLRVNTAVKKYLALKGFDAKMGARPLRRCIQIEIGDVLSQKLLEGEVVVGSTVDLSMKAEQIQFTITKPKALPKRKSASGIRAH